MAKFVGTAGFLSALLVIVVAQSATAQDPAPPPPPDLPVPQIQVTPQTPVRAGRIVGRIIEENGQPVSGAQVGIAALGGPTTTSGIDGRYTLLGVTPGATAITVRAIGFAPKTVSGVQVPEGGVVSQDVTLASQGVQLTEITVEASQERGTVAAALQEQRDASNIVNAVTAEQIEKSPDADAAQAVQRVSGVTVQDGRYVFVRGLGERYTTTSLNNARLPSPEPERKVVPLDLFPANLLEAVTTSKTFTPDQPGDFSGAQVNLRTREFTTGRVLNFSFSGGYNSAVTGRSVQRAPTTGSEWRALGGDARTIPQPVENAGNLQGTPSSDIPGIIGSFRDVWNAQTATGAPIGSTNISLGGEDPVFGHLLGYLGSFSYAYGAEAHRNEQRAIGVSDGNGGARPQNEYHGETTTGSVLWGGILNFNTRLGSSTKLSFSNTYNRSGDNTAVRAAGFNEEFAQNFDITRLQYVTRSIRSNQLAGEHLLMRKHTLAWSVTSSGVTRSEPDRSDLVYTAAIDSTTGAVTPIAWFGAPRTGDRTYSDVSESAWQGDGSFRFSLGSFSAIKVGGQYRTTDRGADSRSYDILNQSQTPAELARPADQVLSDTTKLFLSANANGGRYDAADRLGAGFAQFELPVGSRIRLIGGARVEHSHITVDTRATNGVLSTAELNNTDVLPSLAANINLGRQHQLRLSATQTLSRPEYRELSNVCYFEILGGLTVCGNNQLQRALIQNVDARWEWYPRSGEVLSFGVFAKHFDKPIERIVVATTGANQIGFVNADGAVDYGVEFELQRNLGMLASALRPFSLSVNVTLMHSQITTGNDSVTSLTNNQRAMVGQAPYVVNAGLAYVSGAGRFSGTLLYNVVGRRIVEAGVQPLPDTYEEARSVLDGSLRYDVSRGFSVKLDLKNLLDAPYNTTQGAVTRSRYTVGRSVSAGFSWQP